MTMDSGAGHRGARRARPVAALAGFARREDGLSSVDWVVIAAGATGIGLMALSMGQDTLGTHSANVRGELEDGRFEAPWLDSLPVPQN